MKDAVEIAVEAGAKAFHDAARKMAAQDNTRTLRWETSTEEYRQGIRDLVRPAVVAAIAALRIPTSEMHDAATEIMNDFGWCCKTDTGPFPSQSDVFTAMIDAALAQKADPPAAAIRGV